MGHSTRCITNQYHTHLMERIATYFAKREAKKRIMENFDIEAMKKKYSEESPEEKEKRTKMEMFPAVMNIIVGIAMVVMGALNDDEGNGDKDATYFLKVPGVQFNMMTQKKICIALHMPLTLPFIIWYSIGFSYLWLVVAKRLQKCHHLKEKENKEISKLFCKNNVSFSSSKIAKLQNLKRTMVFCNQNCSDLL